MSSFLDRISTTRLLVTTGLSIAGMMTVDPLLSRVENWISPAHASAMQNSALYRTAVTAVVIIVAQVAADKLIE
jgi:hypothetical protein